MNLIEALKISEIVRRKSKPSHVGSDGNGWVSIQIMIGCDPMMSVALQLDDLLAEDWEANPKYPRWNESALSEED